MGAVGKVELYRRGGIPADIEEQAIYLCRVFHDGDLLQSAGFDLVAVGDFMRVFKVLVEVLVDGFVAQVKGSFKAFEFQVLPAGLGAIASVWNEAGIAGDLEGVWADAVVSHIGFFRKLDAEVASGFRGNDLFFLSAGGYQGKQDDQADEAEHFHAPKVNKANGLCSMRQEHRAQ